MEKQIIPWYLSETRHPTNMFYIEEIWMFNDNRINTTHDVLQWLFPLDEPSNHNINAPILSEDEIDQFRTNQILQERIIKSFNFYLRHLGFTFNKDKTSIIQADDFIQKKDWVTYYHQTFLRITRVLKCLVLFDLKDYAILFFKALQELYKTEFESIGEDSFKYWSDAVNLKV